MTGKSAACRRPGRTLSITWLAFATLLNCVLGIGVNKPSRKTTRIISTKKDGGLSKVYRLGGETDQNAQGDHHPQQHKVHSIREAVHQINSALRSTFLPSGYPTRTPPGYLRYSAWSWCQDLSTQLRSVLATQRVLEGVGVGREGATALSALMNFLVRDGCGMAATLVFTSVASSRFKSDVKRWRLFADVMVDLGITLEATATLVPKALFLPMISIGNMCKAMCGVAAGACGGAINLHWAKGSDISDVQAKFGAQHTVTGSLGLIFAALFARSVSTVNQTKLWTLYALLTILHVVANMRCMRLISFDSFNNARMKFLVQEFLDWKRTGSDIPGPTFSTPSEIAEREPLFFIGGQVPGLSSCPIHLGVSFNELVRLSGLSAAELETSLLKVLKDSRYVVKAGISTRGSLTVVVSFLANTEPRDQAKAFLHALLLSHELNQTRANDLESIAKTEAKMRENITAIWDVFERSCHAAGWDLSKTELRSKGFELEVRTS
jgi:hypothetical protein